MIKWFYSNGIITGSITPALRGPESNWTKGILPIFQRSKNGASLSDGLVSYLENS